MRSALRECGQFFVVNQRTPRPEISQPYRNLVRSESSTSLTIPVSFRLILPIQLVGTFCTSPRARRAAPSGLASTYNTSAA